MEKLGWGLEIRLVHQCVCPSCRQQIEDCESEIRRLKELLKKREENERKYQGQLVSCFRTPNLGEDCMPVYLTRRSELICMRMRLLLQSLHVDRVVWMYVCYVCSPSESLSQLNTIAEQQAKELLVVKVWLFTIV